MAGKNCRWHTESGRAQCDEVHTGFHTSARMGDRPTGCLTKFKEYNVYIVQRRPISFLFETFLLTIPNSNTFL